LIRTKNRLLAAVLILTLPLLLSHCSKKPPQGMNPQIRPIKPAEAAKMDTIFGYDWNKVRRQSDAQKLPPESLEALGDAALQTRDYEGSLTNFLQLLQADPNRYDLHYKVGVIFLLTGRYDAARQELALVLANRPEMLEAHEALGMVHLQEKQYPQAIEEFMSVLSKEPRRAQARHLLGVAYLEAGQPQRAIPELREAASLEPTQASTVVALGQAYARQKDYQAAVTALKKAQSLNPQNQKTNYELGMALAALKRYPEALEAFVKAGDEAQAYNNIGVHYYLDGRYEEAAKCFQRAIDLRPTFYDEAKANLQRALEKMQHSREDGS
jgi:Flp pilus assembly protein TadD